MTYMQLTWTQVFIETSLWLSIAMQSISPKAAICNSLFIL